VVALELLLSSVELDGPV
jgi:hypothetical protein